MTKTSRNGPGPAAAAWTISAVLLAVAIIAAFTAPLYYVTLLIVVGLAALSASGLTLLLLSGQLSLGHAAYAGIGAYVTAIVARDYGVPPVAALLLGVTVTGIAAALVGLVTLRLRGHFLPLATLALGIAIPASFTAAGSVTGGASGFPQIPPLSIGSFALTDDRAYAVLVWLVLLVIVAGFSRLLHARIGRATAALRSHSDMAEVFGVDVPRLKLTIFVVAAMLAGLSGGLYAFYFKFLSPAPFSLPASINLLIACILGGAAHPFGAVLGAVAVTALEVLLQNAVARGLGLSGHVEMIVFGLVLAGTLLKWPGGIWSAIRRFWPGFRAAASVPALELAATKPAHGDRLLALHNVGKNFGGLRAVDDVSFSVGAKEIVGLIGPNGAGKSTIFNIATGLTAPTDGRVDLLGSPPPRRLCRLPERGVARTFQHVKLASTLTVIENVTLGAYSQGRAGFLSGMFGLDRQEEAAAFAKARRALDIVGLGDVADQPASGLAMGQARLVEVARALVGAPSILLLDEPAAGLRTGEKLKLAALLKRLKRTGTSVLLVEHDMDLVMNSVDRMVVLDRGRWLASGEPEAVRRNPEVIAAYLGA